MSSFALRVAALMGFAVPDEPVEPIIPMVSPPGTYTMSYSRLATGETLYTGPGADTVTDEINSIRKLIICMMIYDMKSAVFDVKDVQFLSSDDDFLSPWISGLPGGAMISWRDVCALMLIPSATDVAQTASRIIGAELRAIDGLGANANERFTIALNAKLDAIGDTVSTIYGATPQIANPSAVSTPRKVVDWLQLVADDYPDLVTEMLNETRTITPDGGGGLGYRNENPLIDGMGLNKAGLNWVGAGPGKTGDNSTIKSMVFSWDAPNGDRVYTAQHGSNGNQYRFWDSTSMLLHVEDDFPFLSEGRAAADPLFSNVVFLVGNTAVPQDLSSYAHPLNLGGGLVGTLREGKQFAYEYDTNGTNQYIRAADHAALDLGAEDFTIEMFVRGKGAPSGTKYLLSKYKPTGTSRSYQLRTNSNNIEFWYSLAGNDSSSLTFSTTSAAQFWNGARRHIAMQRQGNEIAMFLNGQKVNSVDIGAAALNNSGIPLVIASQGDPMVYSEINLGPFKYDGVRITKGVCRYNFAGFSVPGVPFLAA